MLEKKTSATKHSPSELPRSGRAVEVQDRVYVESLIRRIVDACPDRAPTSDAELRAQQMLQAELNTRGVRTHLLPFRFNANLYAVLTLHFGVGLLGSLMFFISPVTALLLHTLAGVSYLAEASHWGYLLRRLLPWRRSQNLLGRLPARGKPKLRIVLVGHADAAHTGVMFNPFMVSGTSSKPYPQPFAFARKHMLFAVMGFFALALIDVMALTTGQWMTMMFWGLNVGTLIGFVLNLQVVLQNQIVPGASDNLSGCAALPVLASRFADKKPDDVEMVFVTTGCEESGVGGSSALMRQMRKKWDKKNTIVIGLDILTNGKLCYKTVNEVLPFTLPAWLVETLHDVADKHDDIEEIGVYDACAGTDDAVPFVAKGYDGICLACSDPRLGVSRQYHLMSDTPDNCNFDQLIDSINFAEEVVDEVIRRKLSDTSLSTRRIVARLDERPTGAFAYFTFAWVWPLMGIAAGVYSAWAMQYEWVVSLNAFRGAVSSLVVLFPLLVVLDWLKWEPDKRAGCNFGVFLVMATVAITGLGLLVSPALSLMIPGAIEWNASLLMTSGGIAGLIATLPIAFRLQKRK